MLRTFKRIALPALALMLSGCIHSRNDEVLVTPYTKIDFTSVGEAREFVISSNFLWTIEISDTWITINPMKGYGDKNIIVTAAANTDLAPRETSFFIVGEDTRREITVTQTGEEPALSIDATQKTVSAEGDTVSVGVTTNVELNVAMEADWISFVETRTITTKRYIFNIEPNTTLEDRSGRIQFSQKNGSLSAMLTITQNGENPNFDIETDLVEMDAEGGEARFTVVSNIDWDAASETSWIHITGTRLMEPHDCIFTADANPRVEPRQGSITVFAPDHPELGETTVNVEQNGAQPVATLTPEALEDIPAAGGIYTVDVEANFNWEEDLSQTAEWVVGVVRETDRLKINIDENDNVEARSTTLSIKQENGTYRKSITIEQQAGERQLLLPSQENIPKVPAEGGLIEIPVVSNVSWEAGVSEDWLSVVQTKGLETKTLSLEITPNAGITQRQALLYVMTQGEDVIAVSRVITQEAAQPHITCEPDTLEMTAEGGSFTVPVRANVPWSVLSHPAWVENITVENAQGNNGDLAFTVLPNRQTTPRSSKIELTRTDGTLTSALVINQAAEAVFVNAQTDAATYLHNEGDTFIITVESNIETECVTDDGWIINTEKTTQDRTTVWTYEALPVPTENNRYATVQVREKGTDQVYHSFDLAQGGARIALRDSAALVRFYNNMKGANWRDTHLWNLQLPANLWPGVTLETAVRNGALYVK
ncbi:MAG: BACON domain-containing carbohydrate-binding protein, partial [Bacteroidales bacterium]